MEDDISLEFILLQKQAIYAFISFYRSVCFALDLGLGGHTWYVIFLALCWEMGKRCSIQLCWGLNQGLPSAQSHFGLLNSLQPSPCPFTEARTDVNS